MSGWIFLSKGGEDEYINMLAKGAGMHPVNSDDFDYHYDVAVDHNQLVLRGILKHKIMKKCLEDGNNFYYMDSGYVGNNVGAFNGQGIKKYHRIVLNDLQHRVIRPRPSDRWDRLGVQMYPRRRYGNRIIVAAPDEKPCKYYGINHESWAANTVAEIKKHTDRPVEVRERAPRRIDRVLNEPLSRVLEQDVHALVTFNSVAAVESILAGVPAFVLAPSHVAEPVANRDLSRIDDPFYPDQDLLMAWCHSMAYGQYHVKELKNGTAFRMMQEL
jgi:hypothetical protein